MSYKFHAFRAKNDDDLQQQVGIMKYLAYEVNPGVKLYGSDEGIEIQVFRTSTGIVYRVLESGYGLQNKMWHHTHFFPQCSYDNRSEVPDEDLPNKAVADEVDDMIRRGMYSIMSIIEVGETR